MKTYIYISWSLSLIRTGFWTGMYLFILNTPFSAMLRKRQRYYRLTKRTLAKCRRQEIALCPTFSTVRRFMAGRVRSIVCVNVPFDQEVSHLYSCVPPVRRSCFTSSYCHTTVHVTLRSLKPSLNNWQTTDVISEKCLNSTKHAVTFRTGTAFLPIHLTLQWHCINWWHLPESRFCQNEHFIRNNGERSYSAGWSSAVSRCS
jgi:hypothetical protein